MRVWIESCAGHICSFENGEELVELVNIGQQLGGIFVKSIEFNNNPKFTEIQSVFEV
ncbi:MAG: hypothetical protein ACTSUE_19815 [Promethearchaeota archaeon]